MLSPSDSFSRMRPGIAKLALAVSLALPLAAPASALSRPAPPAQADPASLRERVQQMVPGCGCEARADLVARRDRIAAAGDLDTARTLALEDATRARQALAAARRVVPFARDLGEAHERLERYEADVRAEADVAGVTLRFEELVQLASANPSGLGVVGVDGTHDGGDHGGSIGCSFSRGELAAIVIGFVLGILPGLILLVVLC